MKFNKELFVQSKLQTRNEILLLRNIFTETKSKTTQTKELQSKQQRKNPTELSSYILYTYEGHLQCLINLDILF